MKKISFWILNNSILLLATAFVGIFVTRLCSAPDFTGSLIPQNIYQLAIDIRFDQDDETINIETYIPQDNERQHVIEERFVNNGLGSQINEDDTGRKAYWSGESKYNSVQYKALLGIRQDNYQITDDLVIPRSYEASLAPFLKETDVIQINHPEIKTLWNTLKPIRSSRVIPVLQTIYNYTYKEIEGAPFKGLTDALTALRLKQASCNGKGRLFVALARKNNIPARLVGGLILNSGSKKTSHQWVEAYIEGHWVPFDPTNGHFAQLPENYLSLYHTDQVLFKHTADINFDYLFSIDKRLVASSVYQVDSQENNESGEYTQTNISQILLTMGLAPQTVGLFLLFPLCTLAITFLRNVIGVKTFGVFMPMLIGAACVFTGFFRGIIAFSVILLVSYLAHFALDKMRLLKVARLAAIITINTLLFIVGLSLIGTQTKFEFGMLSLFPVVIISFVAERIDHMSKDHDWMGLFWVSSGTLISIWLCFLILQSFLLEGLFSFYPEFYLLVLATQIYIGRWTGLRLSELRRFKNILGDVKNPVLGINARNRNLVYARNDLERLRLAADKLATKKRLNFFSIPCPDTLLIIKNLSELDLLDDFLPEVSKFVLKPNQGSQGNGILIIVDKLGESFINASGRFLTYDHIRKHCIEIISGAFSQSGEEDIAYFEPLLVQHNSLQKIAPYGLSDIRVILSMGEPIVAMLRMPTLDSDGKANLHQGAVGIALDIKTGKSNGARLNQKMILRHPDNNNDLLDFQIPYWFEIIEMSKKCFNAIELGYMGVDICLDKDIGPLVLEVNGRPGIEIQNILNRGLYAEF